MRKIDIPHDVSFPVTDPLVAEFCGWFRAKLDSHRLLVRALRPQPGLFDEKGETVTVEFMKPRGE